MRSTRANTTARVYVVPGLLNAKGELWKPNQLVTVTDLYSGLDQDMLIGAVRWVASRLRRPDHLDVCARDERARNPGPSA
ncbi:phage baseplate assembly protein [Neoasaia chiangmaiensis]